MSNELSVGLQDGMLAHYKEQARAPDVNVEARLDREPFDYRLHITADKFSQLREMEAYISRQLRHK